MEKEGCPSARCSALTQRATKINSPAVIAELRRRLRANDLMGEDRSRRIV